MFHVKHIFGNVSRGNTQMLIKVCLIAGFIIDILIRRLKNSKTIFHRSIKDEQIRKNRYFTDSVTH